MSIKVTSLVWKHGPRDHATFVVLLALADFADNAGECWPGVDLIASSGRMSKRNVLRALQWLETYGWITVSRKSRDHKGNTYRIVLSKLVSGVKVSPNPAKSDDNVAPETDSCEGDAMSLDFQESDAALSPEAKEVRCQNEQSQVPNQQKSGDKSDKVRCQISIPLYMNHHEPPRNRKEPPIRTQAFVVPTWVPKDAWFGFMEMRRKKRVPTTERAKRGLIAKLQTLVASGQDPGEVLDQSTERGWTSLFEVKRDGGNGGKSFNRAQTAVDSTIAAGRAALAGLGFDSGALDGVGGDDGRTHGHERRAPEIDGRRAVRLTNGRH